MSSTRSINPRIWRMFVPGGRCGAWAAKRKQAAAEKSLRLSLSTSARAMKEVERLRLQRRRLARHCLEFRDRIRLAEQIIEFIEDGANDHLVEIQGLTRQTRHLQEENEHLRADAIMLQDRLRQYQRAVDADTESILDASFTLAKDLRCATAEIKRLRGQRRILAGHLRNTVRKARSWDHLVEFMDRDFVSFWWPLNVWGRAAANICREAGRQIDRISMIPIFGRRGARQVQEALNG
jgi:chromosome segregation ATPase